MKKLLSLLILGSAFLMFASCSSDDDKSSDAPVQLYGSWSLTNDANPTHVTTLNFTHDSFINYSAAHTAVNPTIPYDSPTYTRTILVDPSLAPGAAPGGQKEWTREQGYFTVVGNTLTLWPQVVRTSQDGTTWTETALADITSMETYTFTFSAPNIMVLTNGAGARQTFLR